MNDNIVKIHPNSSSIPLDMQDLTDIATVGRMKAYAIVFIEPDGSCNRWINTNQATVAERHGIYFGLGALMRRMEDFSNET